MRSAEQEEPAVFLGRRGESAFGKARFVKFELHSKLAATRNYMKKLFVGNIPHSTTEAELRALFEPHGAIEQVSIVTDRDTGRSRGFAFVEMTDSAEAEKAIAALNGKELGGRALNINEARPKTDRGGPPRGGRPGGGGGGDVPAVVDVQWGWWRA